MFKSVAVLKGGTSSEREISLISGAAVETSIKQLGLECLSINLTSNSLPIEKLKAVDVVFIALHGSFGEDGQVQNILQNEGICFTGSDSKASQLAQDKRSAKSIFLSQKIPTSKFHIIDAQVSADQLTDYANELGYPLVTKPNNEGSSIGVSIVKQEADLLKAVEEALQFDDVALMETFIDGRSLEVAVIDEEALPIVEVIPDGEFYDYQAKYESDKTQYLFDLNISHELYTEIQATALSAHKALACRDFSRVDLILSNTGTPYVLEVNTIPGLSPQSLLPRAASKAGMDHPTLIKRILEISFNRS